MNHPPFASQTCRRRRGSLAAVACAVLLTALAHTQPVHAQLGRPPYYQPLDQNTPPGQTAAWLNTIRRYDQAWLQPMRVQVTGGGQVDVYSGGNTPVAGRTSPLIVAASAGHLYRLKVSEMPLFPGLEIYPTVELVDRLHPPAGREDEFPVPIIITADDIKIALRGQLVTRVIYLEQPQIAASFDPLDAEIPQSVAPTDNALQEADRLGRPMAIIRIGGRQPSAGSPPGFFGTGGAVQVRPVPEQQNPPAAAEVGLPSQVLQTSGRKPGRNPVR